MINHFVRIKTHLFFWMLSGWFYLQKSSSGLCYGSKMLMNEIICCIDVELWYSTLLGCIIYIHVHINQLQRNHFFLLFALWFLHVVCYEKLCWVQSACVRVIFVHCRNYENRESHILLSYHLFTMISNLVNELK